MFALIFLLFLPFRKAMADDAKEAVDMMRREDALRMRDINLPEQLSNDELLLRNHRLENDIARLEGRAQDVDLELIEISQTVIAIDKQTIDANDRLAQVFALGSAAQQERAKPLESSLDTAIDACHPQLAIDGGEPHRTLQQVNLDCAPLRKIIARVVAIAPNRGSRTPSLMKHLPGGIGEKLLEEDRALLQSDQKLLCGGNT